MTDQDHDHGGGGRYGGLHADQSERREPLLLVVLPAVVAVVVMVAAASALASELPARVPSGWGPDGTVRTMPLWGLTAVLVSTAVLLATIFGAIRQQVGPASAQRVVGGLAVGAPLAIAALHVAILAAVVAEGAEARVSLIGGTTVLLVLAAGSAVGARLVRPVERTPVVIGEVTVPVSPGEAVVWTGRATAPVWLLAVVGTAAVVGVAASIVAAPALGAVVAVVVVVSASLLVVRVTVGPAGFGARLGPFGLVRMAVPLEDVTAVDAIVVEPLAFGGWGVRLLPGIRGIVYRRGPGIRVEQRDGPTMVVTVDHADVAAGVLRAHLDAVPGRT